MVFSLSSMTGILQELAFVGCADNRRVVSSLEVLAGHCAGRFSVRWVCWAERVLSIRACELTFGLGWCPSYTYRARLETKDETWSRTEMQRRRSRTWFNDICLGYGGSPLQRPLVQF